MKLLLASAAILIASAASVEGKSHLRRHEHETVLKGTNYVSDQAAYHRHHHEDGKGYGPHSYKNNEGYKRYKQDAGHYHDHDHYDHGGHGCARYKNEDDCYEHDCIWNGHMNTGEELVAYHGYCSPPYLDEDEEESKYKVTGQGQRSGYSKPVLKGANYVSGRVDQGMKLHYKGPGWKGYGGGSMRKFGGEMRKGPGFGQPGMKTKGPDYQGGEGGWPKGPGGGGPKGPGYGRYGPHSYKNNPGYQHREREYDGYDGGEDGYEDGEDGYEDGEDEGYDGEDEEDEGYDDGEDGDGGGVCGNPYVSAPACDYVCQGGNPVCKNDDEEEGEGEADHYYAED